MIKEVMELLFGHNGALMGMAVLPWIGAGLSVASSIGNAIFGGRSARKQRDEQLRAINEAKRENRNWYNRRYNEDATQRADAQRMLSRTNEAIARRNRAAAGKKAVIGGTDATLASTQRANAEAVGNALADIIVNAEARKDNIEAQYRQREQELDAQAEAVKANAEAAKRANTAAAATAAINAGANIVANSVGGDTKAAKGATEAAAPKQGAAREIAAGTDFWEKPSLSSAAKTEKADFWEKPSLATAQKAGTKGFFDSPSIAAAESAQTRSEAKRIGVDAPAAEPDTMPSTLRPEVSRKKGAAAEPDTMPSPSQPDSGRGRRGVGQSTVPMHEVERKKGNATGPDTKPSTPQGGTAAAIVPQATMPQHTVPPRKKGRAAEPDTMPAKARQGGSHDILPDYENRKDPWEDAVRTMWG